MDKEECTWKNVGEKLASYIFSDKNNSTMQTLKLSYEHLPEHLKPCYLYLGPFPEDAVIPAKKLKCLWIVEGFIPNCKMLRTAEDVAGQYLMELIGRSLVVVAKRRSDGRAKACLIHDLLCEFCLRIAEEQKFLKSMEHDYSIYTRHPGQHVRAKSFQSFGLHICSLFGSHLEAPLNFVNMKLLELSVLPIICIVIFKKFNLNVQAVNVLLDNIRDINRAVEFAFRGEEDAVWSQVAKAQLREGLVSDAIESFIRADDATQFLEVIRAAEDGEVYHDLVKYRLMVRQKTKEPKVDSELIYAYAKIDRLGDIEEFILMPIAANLLNVGDRLYDEALYEAAKIIFAFTSNWGKLASTLVKLKQFQGAVDAARKANSAKTWKEVCFACLDAEEFRLAQICGLNIIVQVDDLEEVSEYYQKRGCFNELISLMESGLGLEHAHMGIFTELGVLYARYCHEKLMEHIKLYSTRLNIPKLIRACDEQQHWKELTYLYIQYDEFDNAATTVMNHSPEAWDHMQFKDIIVKVANVELYYKAVHFYLQEHPDLINDVLNVLALRCGILTDLMNKHDDRIVDLKEQIKALHQELMLSKSLLGDIKLQRCIEIEEAMSRIRDVGYEAEYLINSFSVRDAPLWYLTIRLPQVIHKIKLIGTELEEIKQKCYNNRVLEVEEDVNGQLSLQGKMHCQVDGFTIGLEDKAKHVLDHLVGGPQHLQIIIIYGMPGLGKTTLAKKLYNHPTVNCRFDRCTWCVVYKHIRGEVYRLAF